jgi:Uma2 family endonuclease
MSEDTFFPSEEMVEFRGISWEEYLKFLQKLRPYNLRFIYHCNRLEIMSLFPEHELYKRLLGRFVESLAEYSQKPVYPVGSTLFQRPQSLAITPDDCFYFNRVKQMQGKKQIDLNLDPPPDLVIEIDLDYRSGYHLPVYAELGVPEIWLFNGQKLTIYRPYEQAYLPGDRSSIFPQFPITQIVPILQKAQQTSYHKSLYEMRCLIQDYL